MHMNEQGNDYVVDRVKTKAARGSKSDRDKDSAKDDGYVHCRVDSAINVIYIVL